MKLNTIVAGLVSSLALVGCQSTTSEAPTPTANQQTIEEARSALAEYEEFTVDDSGVISLVQTLPPKHHWKTTIIKKIGREVSCDSLRYFVDKGMVVNIHFKGPKGRYDNFDQQRCLQEDQYL
tara:strand:- start:503 stop:871 length:369 start_codon:yes stop_codon:yes gene_type:complete